MNPPRMTKLCKECGGSFEKLWSRGRCYFCSLKAYDKKERKGSPLKSKTKRKKTSPKTELDIAFGNYIKQKNVSTSGEVFCFTSLWAFPLSQIEAGHFVGRGCMSLRWDEYNVFPQSYGDNRFKGGNLEVYALHLDMIYGEGFAEKLRISSRETKRYHPNEIRELTEYYRKLTKELVTDENIGKITDSGKIMWKDKENCYICLGERKKLFLI